MLSFGYLSLSTHRGEANFASGPEQSGRSLRSRFSRSIPKRLAQANAVLLLAMACGAASAGTVSFTGTLSSPEDTASFAVTLSSIGTITLQTYGFGGGTNAADIVIPPGGFDPFVGLFSGSGAGAVFINGTSDILSNFSPGCPPAGLVTIGSVPDQCGDVNIQFTGLGVGTYTVLLTDGEYVPNALFEAPPAYLGDGFTDLTGGVFQTCYDADDCNTDTANWALDITAPAGSTIPPPSSVPEPSSAPLAAVAMALGASVYAKSRKLNRGGN
jgi:hypothetical protein